MGDIVAVFAFGAFEALNWLTEFWDPRATRPTTIWVGLLPAAAICVAAGLARWRVYQVLAATLLGVGYVVTFGYPAMLLPEESYLPPYLYTYVAPGAAIRLGHGIMLIAMAAGASQLTRRGDWRPLTGLIVLALAAPFLSIYLVVGSIRLTSLAYEHQDLVLRSAHLAGAVFAVAALLISLTALAGALPLGPRDSARRRAGLIACGLLLAVLGLFEMWSGLNMLGVVLD